MYSFQHDFADLMAGRPHAERLVGVRNASTYAGFCNGHDTSVFRPIETAAFIATPEQVALLTYRAVCRELYAKQRNLDLRSLYEQLDKGRPPDRQRVLHKYFRDFLQGTELAIRDLDATKAALDGNIASSQFGEIHFYVVMLAVAPDIMVSTMLNPEIDFEGNVLQTLLPGTDASWISFSLIATDQGGAAVFGWIGENDVALRLIESLDSLPDDELPDALVRFSFEMAENTYGGPAWWDGLPNQSRQRLLTRMRDGGVPYRTSDALRDDGLRVVTWPIASRIRQLPVPPITTAKSTS